MNEEQKRKRRRAIAIAILALVGIVILLLWLFGKGAMQLPAFNYKAPEVGPLPPQPGQGPQVYGDNFGPYNYQPYGLNPTGDGTNGGHCGCGFG